MHACEWCDEYDDDELGMVEVREDGSWMHDGCWETYVAHRIGKEVER
jgi:hypothetical protein